jgi:hypothetical protein
MSYLRLFGLPIASFAIDVDTLTVILMATTMKKINAQKTSKIEQ